MFTPAAKGEIEGVTVKLWARRGHGVVLLVVESIDDQVTIRLSYDSASELIKILQSAKRRAL